MTPPASENVAQKPGAQPSGCIEVEQVPAFASFLKQLALSVTVAVVTSYMLEKFHRRPR
jgi:hypothetical protein